MKKTLYRIVAICLIIAMCMPLLPVEAKALSYNGSSSYMSGKYYKALTKVTLTGNQRKDIVNVAKSQVGYQEGSSSSQLSGTKYGGRNYTEYGRWYGMQDMWCAMFVSWCARRAGVSTSVVPSHAYTPSGLSWFKSRGLAYSRATVAAGGYTPQAGDIIYFKSSRNSNSTNHIGIVTGYSKGTVYTIEGNTSSATISTNGGAVASKSYSISNKYIVYICKPNYKNTSSTTSSSSSSNNSSNSSNSSTLYTNKNNWIPNNIQSVVFNATYYANKYPDLKKAFGTDGNKLYDHFLNFGAKEGRQASAIFDVKTYVSKNADLKKAFGNDYKAAIKHFASNGINENRVTAPAANIGTGFKAKINVSTATLNLSLSGTDVISYTPSDAAAQIWKFDRQSDGTYKITNTKTGQVLDLYSASKKAGAKVQICNSNNKAAQRWYIYESGTSGKYIFRPACSPGIIMGVKGDSKSASAAIQSVNYTNSNGQKFGITKISSSSTEKPVDLGTDFYAKIGLSTTTNMNLSLMDNNVILYKNSNVAAQTWRFARQDDGSYIIVNQKTGTVLTVDGNGSASGTNVGISKNTKATGQKWFIYKKGDYYQLRPANAKNCALDVYGGLTDNETNVQIYTKNDTGAQLFKITKGDYFSLVGPENVGTGFIANINNVKSGMNFTLEDANVITYSPTNARHQKYLFERQSDGSYKLTNQSNNHVLTVKGGSSSNNTQVQVSKSNDSTSQRWFIYLKEGSYIFRPASAKNSVLAVYNGSTELRTKVVIYTMNNSAAQKFTIKKLTTETITYSVASPYNTNSKGKYNTLDEAKKAVSSVAQYGYVVYDSKGKCVYTPATSLNASKILWEAKEAADYMRTKGWVYGDAKKNPYLDKSEKVVSCDRFCGWVLGDAGYTKGQPSVCGLPLYGHKGDCKDGSLEQFLIQNGFTKITDINKVDAGDIVFVGYSTDFAGLKSEYRSYPRHVFICASSYKAGGGVTYRYDAGSNSRIQSNQPSKEPLSYSDNVFRFAYRAPATGNISNGSTSGTTNTNSMEIPAAIKKLVFDANYYSNNHADLKKDFGTDEAQLYQHFLDYGIKEGRQAHPTFNIKNYLSENADLKAAFGTDYVKGMKHYIEFGHNEKRVTALNVNIGTEFYAKIGTVNASGKNLSLVDTNVILYGNSKAAAQTWRFVRQSDGSYIIINQKNGFALTVEGNSSKSGANVQIQKNTGSAGQKWFITANNGKYSLRPACASSCVLDLYGGETADLTNIQIHTKNNTDAQLFTITKGSFFDLVGPMDLGTGFTAKINNVKSGLNLSLNDTNVIIYTPSDAAAQKYVFDRQSDGSYKLTNTKNNYVLTVEGGSNKNNTNAVISKSDNSKAQSWFIYMKEGSYIFRPACATNSVLEACGGSTELETKITIYTMNNTPAQKFTIEKVNSSTSSGSASGNKYATAEEMAVLRKIMYAVETGGQVYGKAGYDDFTEAYTNTSLEHAITIGAGQWFGPEAKTLLNKIRTQYPSTFASLDTAGIAYDLDHCNWSTYKLSKSSAKAKCIVKIISSDAGRACQDELMDEQMLKYLEEARSLGVTDLKGMMMCANFRHLGGLGAVKRILNKTEKPYTLDNIYEASLTDTGNQAGAFRSRNRKVYNWLEQYID